MQVFAVLEQPGVVRQILDHLGLPTAAPPEWPNGLAADPPRDRSSEPFVEDLPTPEPVIASRGGG
jgi:hypothetical protein